MKIGITREGTHGIRLYLFGAWTDALPFALALEFYGIQAVG